MLDVQFDPERWFRLPAVAGLLGSIVALRFSPGASWPERAGNLVGGSLCAVYGTPALGEWLQVATSPGLQAFLAFAVGMFGLSFAAAANAWVRELKASDLLGLLPWRKGG